MPEYTMKPIPVYEAAQINSREDADAWLASLTDNELVSGETSITNLRIDINDITGMVWLRYTLNGNGWSSDTNMDASLGAYVYASKNGNLYMAIDSAENFTRLYQPYPIAP